MPCLKNLSKGQKSVCARFASANGSGPKLSLEKASIDEAFIDLTAAVRELMVQRFPHLLKIPEDATPDTPLPDPPSISWDGLGHLIPLTADSQEPEQAGSSSSVNPEAPVTWHDVALSIGAELMFSVRESIKAKLGYSTSAVRVFDMQNIHLTSSRASLEINS
jgi:DNA polymerase eta